MLNIQVLFVTSSDTPVTANFAIFITRSDTPFIANSNVVQRSHGPNLYLLEAFGLQKPGYPHRPPRQTPL